MKRKKSNISHLGLLFLCLFLVTGCPAVAFIPEAIMLGASVAGSTESADIDAAVSPGVVKEDFGKIKRIAILFDKPQTHAAYGDLTNVVADSITIELMKLGFDVVERQQLSAVVKAQQLQQTGLLGENLIKMGEVLGVNAVVTGSVTSSQSFKTGFMGMGSKMTHLVQNASLKIISCENARTLMVVTLNYKKGQKPHDAAKSIAAVLKLKIDDPFGEIKKKKD